MLTDAVFGAGLLQESMVLILGNWNRTGLEPMDIINKYPISRASTWCPVMLGTLKGSDRTRQALSQS